MTAARQFKVYAFTSAYHPRNVVCPNAVNGKIPFGFLTTFLVLKKEREREHTEARQRERDSVWQRSTVHFWSFI